MIFTEHKPDRQLCYAVRALCPAVGQTISFRAIEQSGIMQEIDMARLMKTAAEHPAGFVKFRIFYTQVLEVGKHTHRVSNRHASFSYMLDHVISKAQRFKS